MELSLPPDDLERYVLRLLSNHFPDGISPALETKTHFTRALERVEHCFSKINRKYYKKDDEVVFDHLNSDHMAALLYFFANTVWRDSGDEGLPTRLFYLNKVMHGLDLFYSVTMPDVFLLVHPLGTILGNAQYGNYLVVYQNCTVGAVTTVYPKFGDGTILYSRTSVLGQCYVGDNVVFAANSFVINQNIPSNSIVVGQYPAQRLLPNPQPARSRCFDPLPDIQEIA